MVSAAAGAAQELPLPKGRKGLQLSGFGARLAEAAALALAMAACSNEDSALENTIPAAPQAGTMHFTTASRDSEMANVRKQRLPAVGHRPIFADIGHSRRRMARETTENDDIRTWTKAMLKPRKREGIKTFYFTTNTFSIRVAHYKANPKASIYFCDAEGFKGMMLRGTMEVLTDAASKEVIWREGDEQYYPGGVTDPNYCVLKFTATDGRFYSDFYPRSFVIE